MTKWIDFDEPGSEGSVLNAGLIQLQAIRFSNEKCYRLNIFGGTADDIHVQSRIKSLDKAKRELFRMATKECMSMMLVLDEVTEL